MKPDDPRRQLSDGAFARAAETLAVDEAIIRAFAEVESGSLGAFLPSGLPVILFERHKFYAHTKGQYPNLELDSVPKSYSVISSPRPGGYGPSSVQHLKLEAAARLDRDAAIRACSWGLFQILGDNHLLAGHDTLQSFVNAMYKSADAHLAAFVNFVKNNPKRVHGKSLLEALRAHQWTIAAEIYNGPKQAEIDYAGRLSKSYRKWTTRLDARTRQGGLYAGPRH